MIRPLNQIHLKILAVLAAIVLWLFVITVENTIYKYPELLEVKVLNKSENLTLMEAVPGAEVFLRVDEETMKTLTQNDFDLFVDLKNLTAGEHTVAIQGKSLDSAAKILKIEPAEVNIKLSPQAEKEVPVTVKYRGNAGEGFFVSDTSAKSENVKISGAQSTLDRVENVVATVILEGTETGDFNQNVKLELPEDLEIEPGLIKIEPEQISVNIALNAEIREKTVPVKASFVRESDRALYGGKLKIEPAEVTIKGDLNALNQTDYINTEIIEVSALLRNENLSRKLAAPTGISIMPAGQTVIITLQK